MLTLQLQLSNFIFQSEKIRWGQSIESFEAQEKTLCGDVLLTAAFVSYVGSFTKQYRQELVDCEWVPFLQRKVSSAPCLVSIWERHTEISVVKTVHNTRPCCTSVTGTAWKFCCEGDAPCVWQFFLF